jgi:AcrR family transcriptional regulator
MPESADTRGTTRRPRADGLRTRQAILAEAVSLATVDGLEGLSIGNLANAIGMSKSGLYAHFRSKEELQLATVDEAGHIFQTEVVDPALAAAPGVSQLLVLCDAFLGYLHRRVFPGGCFFACTALEMGPRTGAVKDKVAEFHVGFVRLLEGFAIKAIEMNELSAGEDPSQLAFELNGILLAADVRFVLNGDTTAPDFARRVVRRRLGLDGGPVESRAGADATAQ